MLQETFLQGIRTGSFQNPSQPRKMLLNPLEIVIFVCKRERAYKDEEFIYCFSFLESRGDFGFFPITIQENLFSFFFLRKHPHTGLYQIQLRPSCNCPFNINYAVDVFIVCNYMRIMIILVQKAWLFFCIQNISLCREESSALVYNLLWKMPDHGKARELFIQVIFEKICPFAEFRFNAIIHYPAKRRHLYRMY